MSYMIDRDLSKYDRVVQGIACLESALCYHGYSSLIMQNMIVWNPYVDSSSFPIDYRKLEPFSLEDTIKLGGELYVTNLERTLCEMVREECYEEWLCEGLMQYIQEKNVFDLYPYIKKYCGVEKFEHYLQCIDEYWIDVHVIYREDYLKIRPLIRLEGIQ